MTPGRELEMPAQERAGILERTNDDGVYGDVELPPRAEEASAGLVIRPAADSGQ